MKMNIWNTKFWLFIIKLFIFYNNINTNIKYNTNNNNNQIWSYYLYLYLHVMKFEIIYIKKLNIFKKTNVHTNRWYKTLNNRFQLDKINNKNITFKTCNTIDINGWKLFYIIKISML